MISKSFDVPFHVEMRMITGAAMCWIVISFRMNSSMTFIEEMINVKNSGKFIQNNIQKNMQIVADYFGSLYES